MGFDKMLKGPALPPLAHRLERLTSWTPLPLRQGVRFGGGGGAGATHGGWRKCSEERGGGGIAVNSHG